MLRKIVKIDDELCNGCGECVSACVEGAIQLVNGKAKLVRDSYCDGLGVCLGECPQGAIQIEKREAEPFDLDSVEAHKEQASSYGCPGSSPKTLSPISGDKFDMDETPSALRNWPVQLNLIPLQAPYYQDAQLLISADCVPFSYAGFHQNLLRGKTLLMGCPKLDNPQIYIDKLTEILKRNEIQDITVVTMEVPCCQGLVSIVKEALQSSQKEISIHFIRIGINGKILETR